ncbi:hypothetical protein O181_052472 [Austropuccinia psidii MF-1]|uniref:Uncharacterized protein n=1 Tax=Austropuccinia psidii MF-1 TaxID=1389203 RepID=A0A9Q3HQJ8_9BASI|nr:hypothetical protein [Austropuccinia psidii MF-1]
MTSKGKSNVSKKGITIISEKNLLNGGEEPLYFFCGKNLLQNCTNPTLPGGDYPKDSEAKVITAEIETCNIITNSLLSRKFSKILDNDEMMENSHLLWNCITDQFASSTLNSQTRIWSRFLKVTYKGNLLNFIMECRWSLNKFKTIGVKVGTKTLYFALLNTLPDEFHSLIEKVTPKIVTQGHSDTTLTLLHNVALKQEAINSSENNGKAIELNREMLESNTIHYLRN